MAPHRMKNNKHTCKTNKPSNWFRCCLFKLSSKARHLCLMLEAVSKSRYLRLPLTVAQQRLGIVLTGLDNDSAFPFNYTIEQKHNYNHQFLHVKASSSSPLLSNYIWILHSNDARWMLHCVMYKDGNPYLFFDNVALNIKILSKARIT